MTENVGKYYIEIGRICWLCNVCHKTFYNPNAKCHRYSDHPRAPLFLGTSSDTFIIPRNKLAQVRKYIKRLKLKKEKE